MTVTADGSLLASADKIGPSESFETSDTGNGNGLLKALGNSRYITMDPATNTLRANAAGVVNDYGRWNFLYPDKRSVDPNQK